jgi:hypothetical protein
MVREHFRHRLHIPKQEKNVHINICPETFNLWVIAARIMCKHQQQFSINVWAGIVGDYLVGPLCYATSDYRQLLPRFPLTWHAEATGQCTTGSQSTNVVYEHFSRAVRDVLSDTYQHRWTDRGESTTWPPRSSPDFEPLDFYLWVHLKPLCMQLLLTAKRHFNIALWMPVRLSATAPASFNGCGGP